MVLVGVLVKCGGHDWFWLLVLLNAGLWLLA